MPIPRDILIIDDEDAIVDLMMEVLQEEGYTVRSAFNGEQGLNEIEITPPALILLDLHMPGITTTEFLERLQFNGFSCLPVVITTADKTTPQILSTLHEVTYLFKPFDLDTLLECVARFVPPQTLRP